MSDAESQAEAAQRSHDEAEKRADGLASEVQTAAARATAAAAEAERASAERSTAEREAASWAAEAHRLRRSLQASQLLARRRTPGTEGDAAAEPSEAELQTQIQGAMGSREAAARRAAEHAIVEREAAQRAAVARAAVTRLTAARSQAARSAAEQAQRQEDARERIQAARAALERSTAERKAAQAAPRPRPAAAERPSTPRADAARSSAAPSAAERIAAAPHVESMPGTGAEEAIGQSRPTDVDAFSARLLERRADGRLPAAEAAAPISASPEGALRAPLSLERAGMSTAPEEGAAVLRFERGGARAQQPERAEETEVAASRGPALYAERSSGWEKQASLAAAEIAAQESARVSRELARERAERLESTAANARSLLDAPEVSSRHRWAIAGAAAAATVGCLVVGGLWLGHKPGGADEPNIESIEQEKAPVASAAVAAAQESTAPSPVTENVPAISQSRDGEHQPTWLRNAALVAPPDGRPLVAIVIDDMGMDETASAQVIALPAPLTISFLPASPRLARQVEAARARGHEVLAHVPMEPTGVGNDPGPNYLGVIHSKEELRARLSWNLNQLQGIVGINNHMGSLFTRSTEGMQMVMHELHDREMLFLDSRTTQSSVGPEVAAAEGIPFTARDVFLDDERDYGHINDRLREIESIARRRGSGVAIGHPLRATIEALSKWLPEAKSHGVQVTTISQVVRQQMTQRAQSSLGVPAHGRP